MDMPKRGSHYVMANTKAHDRHHALGLAHFIATVFKLLKPCYTPLKNLLCKATVWRWGGTSRAFWWLTRRFVAGPILVATQLHHTPYTWSLMLQICNGAYYRLLCEDEKGHPCAFLSKGSNKLEEIMMCMIRDVGEKRALKMETLFEEGAKHEIDIGLIIQNLKYFIWLPKS